MKGILMTKKIKLKINEFILNSKKKLPEVVVAYETYGTINEDKSNVILVCHALTGDAHAGTNLDDKKLGWWDYYIGKNKAIDTEKYYIISTNILGGCKGTTGPASINPKTKKKYGFDFPVINIKDIVNVQKLFFEQSLLC